DLLELIHELFIDCQSASGVEDDNVASCLLRLLHCSPRYSHRSPASNLSVRSNFGFIRINRNTNLFAKHLQLIDSRRTLEVDGGKQRLMTFAHEQLCQLAAGCGFA